VNKAYASPNGLGAFVNSVCNNVLLEHYRRASKEIGDVVGIDVPDPAIGAVDAIANRQMQQRVRHILTKLSEWDRCLLAAVFLDERDKDEVCRSFAVSREYLRVARGAPKNHSGLCLFKRPKTHRTGCSRRNYPLCAGRSFRAYVRAMTLQISAQVGCTLIPEIAMFFERFIFIDDTRQFSGFLPMEVVDFLCFRSPWKDLESVG
jgi:hypothetical protein